MIPTPAIETDLVQGLLGVAVLFVASLCCYLLLRYARFPASGRAVVAGILAGLLVGPTIFGRVMPEKFEAMYHGGTKHREALEYVRFLSAAAAQSLNAADDKAAQVLSEQSMREIVEKQQVWDEARWRHQAPMRICSMALVALVLLAGATLPIPPGDLRQRWISSASIGFWSFALPAAIAYMCAMRWWDASIEEAVLIAAAVGIGPLTVNTSERGAADGAELGGARMMHKAGVIASLLAILLACWAAWSAGGTSRLCFMLPLIALPIGWTIAYRQPPTEPSDFHAGKPNAGLRALRRLIGPVIATLTATLCLSIDLHVDVTWSMVIISVVLALIADDGRWLGALIGGLLLGGRPVLRTMRLVMPAMAAGTTQLALAVLAIQAGLLSVQYALPILAGVVLIELTSQARSKMTKQIAEVERDITA